VFRTLARIGLTEQSVSERDHPPDGKQSYAIARADGEPLAFAGLWEGWRDLAGEVLRTFTIVTTATNAEMSKPHIRMPVILEPEAWPIWLGKEKGAPAELLRPAADCTARALVRQPSREQPAKQRRRHARRD
jgi:putative SOS response-associated peptidase YedK